MRLQHGSCVPELKRLAYVVVREEKKGSLLFVNKKKQKNFVNWFREIAGAASFAATSDKVFLVLFVHKKNRICPSPAVSTCPCLKE